MKPWLQLGSVAVTLLFLAACSSDLKQGTTDAPALTTQAGQTFTIRFSEDDAEQRHDNGNTLTDDPSLELGERDLGPQTVGLRFRGVNIPQGAKITDARLELTGRQDSVGSATLSIHGHASDNSPAYVAALGEHNIESRSKTTENRTWIPGTLLAGDVYAPNVTGIVQEIVNRGGWKSGNALSFMIAGSGQRQVYSYDGSAASAPRLVVTYDTTLPPPSAISCLGSSYDKTGTRTVTGGDTGASYVVRGGTNRPNYRLDATGLLVKSPKSQIKDGKPEPRQAFLISYNYTTTGNPVSVCVHGGEVEVLIPVSEQWEPYYHGSGSFFVEKSPGAIIESVASIRGGDGFTIKDMERTVKAKIAEELKTPIIVRDSYIGRAGDDGVENDRLNNVKVDNVLIDSAFQGFSCQQETDRVDPRRSVNEGERDFVIRNTLLALRTEKNGSYSSYKLWKWATGPREVDKLDEGNTNCKLYLQNNVFLLTGSNANVKIDPAEYDNVDDVPIVYSECKNNTIVYTGGVETQSGADYWDYLKRKAHDNPTCWTVTDQISVWKAARANWFKNHPQFAKYEANEDGRYNFK